MPQARQSAWRRIYARVEDRAAGFPPPQHATALLLLLGIAAYAASFLGRFQFDDFYLIVNNREMATWAAAWWSLPVSLRPLTKLTLALNVALHGLRPFGFHLVNLALHLFSGLLVYRIARTTESAAPAGLERAWLAATIFLLHPAQTEAVTYISGRSTSLMTACLLLAHWLALRADQADARSPALRFASACAFLGAVLAKETALVYPLLYLVWLRVTQGRPWRQAMARVAPYAAMSLALLLGFLVHPRYQRLILEAAQRLPLEAALFSQARAVVALLNVLIFPWRVNIDHALPVIDRLGAGWPYLGLLCAILLLAAGAARHSRVAAGGLLWGLAALLPTHSVLVRQDLIADRLLYLPMAGFSIAIAELLAELCGAAQRRFRGGVLVWPVTVLALGLGLGVATFRRNLLYRSEAALWQDSAIKAPHNARAHHNLGYAYELAGDLDRALFEYRTALSLRPENERYQESLAIALRKQQAGRAPHFAPR